MRHLTWLAGVTAALTLAALLWLWQSSCLAATGQRIYRLENRRQALVEERARLLVTYAHVTSPDQMAERAEALGFGAAEELTYVTIDRDTEAELALWVSSDAPMALVGRADGAVSALAAERTVAATGDEAQGAGAMLAALGGR